MATDAPPCECHGEPKLKHGGCRIKGREYAAKYYVKHREEKRIREREYLSTHREERRIYLVNRRVGLALEGLCQNCSQVAISETYCWDCLNKKEERRTLAIS